MVTVVGRGHELEAIAHVLDAAQKAGRVLMLEGEAGIGKTTVWRAGVEQGQEWGYRVLATAAAGAEAQLSFTALRDLLGDAFDEVAEEIPSPQRRAMRVVLLREEPAGPPPQPDAIAVAFLTTLRALAARAPVLLAVDDVQWLDTALAAPLGYALRRLGSEAVAVLLS